MGSPIIIDDGGSTRIKQIKDASTTGKMDDLLETTEVDGAHQSKAFAKGSFNQLTISCVDQAGTANPPAGGTFPIAMGDLHTFTIFSDKHRVIGKIVDRSGVGGTAADCEITVRGTEGIGPIVEAKSHKKQRRYIISNAPPIESVKVNAAGAPQTFSIPDGTVYTVVILT